MGSGRSQEIIRKPHFTNGSTKISVLDIRIDSMQHFPPSPLYFFKFWWTGLCRSLSGGRGHMLLSWFLKVQALNSVAIQRFCLYTLLWCYRAKDLSRVGELRGPSICHPTALAERKPHLDFGCMLRPSVSLLLCGSKTSVGVLNRLTIINASWEAAGWCDYTVLMMLYKWRERLILNLVNKCTKVKARWV